jgi:hypothetical protein
MEQACGWGLWDKQREIADAVVHHERVAVPAAFGVGKTYLAARLALWWLYNHKPSKVITTGPTMRQVKDLLWSELRAAHRRSKRPLGGEPLTLQLQLEEDWFALGFATDPDKIDQFTGYHSPHMLVIFDQACGVDRAIWEAAEGLMTGGHARWLAISNTTDAASAMAEVCTGAKTRFGKWKVIPITAYDSPNVKAKCDVIPGIISYDWIEKKMEMWEPSGPMWQIFVEASFVDEAQMTILTGAHIRRMFSEELAEKIQPDFDAMTIGIDVAEEGLDSSVWTVRAGGRLLWIDQAFGNDTQASLEKSIQVWDKTTARTGQPPKAFLVDKIGPGNALCYALEQAGYPVFGINVSKAPLQDDEQFLNLRAELGWNLRRMAEDGTISLTPYYPTQESYVDQLREEMSIRYKILTSGRIQMEPKREIRKRLQRSPDFWDSMMLAFHNLYSAAGTVSMVNVMGNQPRPSYPDGVIPMEEALRIWLRQDENEDDPSTVIIDREDRGWQERAIFW